MAKKDPVFLSKNAYAAYLGINEKAVRKAVAEGKIKNGWDADKQKIIQDVADKEYGHLHQITRAKAGVSKVKLAEQIDRAKSPKIGTAKISKSELKEEILKSPNKKLKKSEVDQFVNELSGTEDLSELSNNELLKLLSVTADMEMTDAVRLNEIVDLALKKKKLEEMENILIRKENVERVLFAFGNQLKQSFLAIPARVIDDILHAPNKVEAINILTKEIILTLEVYSNIESIKLSNKE